MDQAIDIANRMLDIVSIEKRDHLTLKSPTEEYMVHFLRNNCKILQYHFYNWMIARD